MSRRRCVLHCEGQQSMHRLPKDDSLRNRWIQFIFNTIPQHYSPNLFLCSNHFTEDCFLNRKQYNSGFAQRIILKDDATPTLFGPGHAQSQPDAACPVFPSVRHVASQTDPPETKSVGTQLIMKTPVRSTATQVTAPRRDRGVCTPTFPLDSPLLFLQPTVVKRPRLKEEEEEEVPLEWSEGGSGAGGLDVTLSPSWVSS